MRLHIINKLSPTISKHPGAGEGGTRQGPQVIEDRDPVPPLLGVVDKGTDVGRLTAVGNTWTEDHCVITWKIQNQNLINDRAPINECQSRGLNLYLISVHSKQICYPNKPQ